jgi:biopolymer transport protein ExbB
MKSHDERRPQVAPLLLMLLLVAALAVAPGLAQGDDAAGAAEASGDFGVIADRAQQDLQLSLAELTQLRTQIAEEKLPLTRKLSGLESRLIEVRAEFDSLSRNLDTRNLELTNLGTEIKGRQDERAYLANLLDEYIRNFETRIHISELRRYREVTAAAESAADDADLTPEQVYRAQTEMIDASIDRLLGLVGGETFDGQAVGEGGRVEDVRFALIGPVALFSTADGRSGLAEQILGSMEPNMVTLDDPAAGAGVAQLISSGSGVLPLDPSLGNAQKIVASTDSLKDQVLKGGAVMWPILVLAASALLVAVAKWFQLARVPQPSPKRVKSLMDAMEQRDFDGAERRIQALSGPTADMLGAGIRRIHDPKELIEEVMFEKTLETRLRLQSFLSFVAVAAAAAPLLGLLGTVTGIIKTFQMITVFGTGDAKTLSSGISEALITTKFGLIVAIPSLLLHAFLSRKARRLIDGMEKTAVSFLNRIPPSGAQSDSLPEDPQAGEGSATRDDESSRRSAMPGLIERPAGAEINH